MTDSNSKTFKEKFLSERMGMKKGYSLFSRKETRISPEGIIFKGTFHTYELPWIKLRKAEIVSRKKEQKLYGSWIDQQLILRFSGKKLFYNISAHPSFSNIHEPKDFVKELEKYIEIHKVEKKTLQNLPQWVLSLGAILILIALFLLPKILNS